MSYLEELQKQRTEKVNRINKIKDQLDMTKQLDENGEPQLKLSSEATAGLVAEATTLVESVNKMDVDIKELERVDMFERRDADLSPFAGINAKKEGVVSDFNRVKIGEKMFSGIIPGRTFGETVVDKALALNNNRRRLSESIASVISGEGAAIPVVIDPNTGIFLNANEVDETDLAQAAEQEYGIAQAMASGYFIDLLPVVNGSGRTIQWNETPSRTNSSGFRRTMSGGNRQDGSQFDPTSISRTMSPAEFSVFSEIARSTLQERSDAASWLNTELMINYKDKASPEAFHTGDTLTGIVGIANAALKNNSNEGRIITQNANVDVSDDITGKSEQEKYNLLGTIYMGAIIRLRDALMAQRPGRKVVAVHRNVLTAMQEARPQDSNGVQGSGKMYPGLSDSTPTYAGLTFVPIDVGIPTPPVAADTGTIIGAMTDWGRDTEHIVAERAIFIDPYTARKRGVHVYIHDGKSGYKWTNRFGIGLLNQVTTA